MTITVKQFIDNPPESWGGTVVINTFAGPEEVGYVRWPEDNPEVVCPKANAGFGLSFMVSHNSELEVLE